MAWIMRDLFSAIPLAIIGVLLERYIFMGLTAGAVK